MPDITHLVTETITAEMLAEKFDHVYIDSDGRLQAWKSMTARRVEDWIGRQEAYAQYDADQAEFRKRDLMAEQSATQKQIDFILRLIAQDRHEGCHMTIPTDRDEIDKLSKRDASACIDAMLGS